MQNMQKVTESTGDAKRHWMSRGRAAGFIGIFSLMLSGCSSYSPTSWFDDSPPKPQQIAQSADQGELSEGLTADTSDKYAKGAGRPDVTVVRPLRQSSTPPAVTVGASDPSAPAAAPVTPVTSSLPSEPPVLSENETSTADVSVPDIASPAGDVVRGLDDFMPEAYAVSYLAATVPFNHGSAHLSRSDMNALKRVVDQLKDSGGVLTVVGHASSRTGDMAAVEHKIANFDISVRRAETVARALRKLGVPARSMFVGAVSDNEPMYQEVMPAGEARNRRTEVFLNQ